MSPNLLTSLKIQKYYQNQTAFNIIYSRNNSPKIKDGTYVTNLDEFTSIKTHRIGSYVNGNNGSVYYNATYFDSFRVEHVPKEIKKFMGSKNIITSIYRMQAFDLICGFFCTGLY